MAVRAGVDSLTLPGEAEEETPREAGRLEVSREGHRLWAADFVFHVQLVAMHVQRPAITCHVSAQPMNRQMICIASTLMLSKSLSPNLTASQALQVSQAEAHAQAMAISVDCHGL